MTAIAEEGIVSENHSDDSGAVIDPAEFRKVLGQFATGVTIVTTRDEEGNPQGLTANAFTSVSIDPPLVLVSIATKADSHEHLSNAGFFCVNILGEEHEELSNKFAKHGDDKFTGVIHDDVHTGAPVLDDAIAWIDCQVHKVYEGGDHNLFLGRVVGLHHRGGRPLLFYDGKYQKLPETD